MKVYTTYVNSCGFAIFTIAELKKRSQAFTQFLEVCNSFLAFLSFLPYHLIPFKLTFLMLPPPQQNKKKCNNLDLQSFLIQPVQRIPRYVLLVEVSIPINRSVNRNIYYKYVTSILFDYNYRIY